MLELIAGLAAVFLISVVVFLPTIVAGNRKHKSGGAIFVCNVVGLFFGLFWIIALIWSFTGNVEE